MSEALSTDLIQFDDAPRPGVVPDDGPATIGRVLKEAGVDAPCTLYNEALEFARDGHLGQAMGRLQMLLVLDPDDADAQLLLAKVHAAQGRPSEALGRLDAATASGGIVPAGFREYLEAAIRAERSRDEELRARVAAREQAEVRALRGEARQLRSDNVRLETEVTDAIERERVWKYATIGASIFGSIVILVLAFVGGPAEAPARVASPAVVEAPAPPVAMVETPVAAPAMVEEAVPAPVRVGTPESQTHVVGDGDTLYKLSKRYYGNATKWERIRDANPGKIRNGVDLTLGSELVIPAE